MVQVTALGRDKEARVSKRVAWVTWFRLKMKVSYRADGSVAKGASLASQVPHWDLCQQLHVTSVIPALIQEIRA